MQNLRKFMGDNRERLASGSLRLRKRVYQFFKIRKASRQKTILFIIGCQRSGTTLLTEIFEQDFNTRVYGEFSKLSSRNSMGKIRLKPFHLVEIEIEKNRAPFIIVKPLVETQNILNLLSYFHNSKALWVFRSYRDVALSNIRHWGTKNGIEDLRSIIENQPGNWRAEKVSDYTRSVIEKYFCEDMNPYDAAALFWFARNRLFFELDLTNCSDVMVCNYEDLVENPRDVMNDIYKFLGCEYASGKILDYVYSSSKDKGADIDISPDVDHLCKGLLEELNKIYRSKYNHTHAQKRT